MDNQIRENKNCVIGLPSCNYIFNSTKSCFIAYGFSTSQLEVDLVSDILKENFIESIEAKSDSSHGQHVFCTKICSKIITSRFCIIFINNDIKSGVSMPNANVYMEYGLMLGFNKYIIPFQKEEDNLAFNISGLDTIKYNQSNFKEKAKKAILEAIKNTNPNNLELDVLSEKSIEYFLLIKGYMLSNIEDVNERAFFKLGSPMNFLMANDFSGLTYMYFGDFRSLNRESIMERIKILFSILASKGSSIKFKQDVGIINNNPKVLATFLTILKTLKIWILCNNENDKDLLTKEISEHDMIKKQLIKEVKVFSENEIFENLTTT